MNTTQKRVMMRIGLLIVITLFLNLPIINALELANVQAVNISDTSAVITWETDEPANSFVRYGQTTENLQSVGDATPVLQHSLALENLIPQTAYQYSVESNTIIDDNNGQYYSLTTLAPDTTAPAIEVEIPAIIKGDTLDISGSTEAQSQVSLSVQGIIVASARTMDGAFLFPAVRLDANQNNSIFIEAVDSAGNREQREASIFADTQNPVITITTAPNLTTENSFELKASLSEESSFEIFQNNKSVKTGEGNQIKETLRLEEGKNIIIIAARDSAGWESSQEVELIADTRPPTVTAKLESGNEYYQGRATSSIHGETEPGAELFLYVYRPLGYQYNPPFDKAWAKVTANELGEFTFSNINFEDEPFRTQLQGLAPRQVPSGLQEYEIGGVQQTAAQQQFTYYLFIIAEDASGKTAYWQSTINVNTCLSGNFDFDVQSIAQLQAPLRLNPQLLDEGREVITATFNMSYRGNGQPKRDPASGITLEPAFEVSDVQFEKACTQGMLDDDAFKLACQILPQSPKKIGNADRTAWFLSYNLHSAEEVSEKKEDYWNEFKKRRIVFPLKVRVNYREREASGQLGPMKTQASCVDVGYFIDIPIESKDMLPDFIADEGLDAIDATIKKMDLILPYLEKAILISGVGCISSFLGRMATRWARIVTARLEVYFDRAETDEKKKCPSEQYTLHLKSTIDHWKELQSKGVIGENTPETMPRAGKDENWEEKILDDRCPNTASLWEFEETLDQAYRWTCDRVFCRAVPAAWTSKAEKSEVDTAILSQQQCSVTSKGVALIPVENCQEKIAKDVTVRVSDKALELKQAGAFPCYLNPQNNQLYYISEPAKGPLDEPRSVTLQWLAPAGGLELNQAFETEGADLIAYKPPKSKDIIVGVDQTCDAVCKNPRRPGYKAETTNSTTNYYNGKADKYGCYIEETDPNDPTKTIWKDGGGNQLAGGNKFAAGYSKDCFVNVDASGKIRPPQGRQTGLLQCVCTPDKEQKEQTYGARTAAKETDAGAEKWDYREDRLFKENRGFGTYYPEWRYYEGRDFSSAFGTNYLLDYLREDPQVHEINPHTQHIGAFQTACLSGIRARIIILRSVLEGLRNCIEEAKITGLHDAGICKTIFSQQVCGLLYKSIAYFFTSCSPYSFSDEIKKGALGDVGAVFEAGLGAIPQAMQTSIDDIKSDYGNAQLNQFFATGAQGFAQSMCMAAFGYDWPLGTDFILDAAYAFPTKTTIHVLPAERELATFNPTRGSAVYNYNVGVAVLPGCKIKSYDTYLKCVGPEDVGHPNVDCGTQGCDCLQATDISTLEGEKIKRLDGGRGFDLKPGSFFSPQIPAPQKVDSNYRYDHVVVELKLDPFESAEQCFDEGYRDGKFYFPIIDISPPAQFVCQVQPFTGKYVCPELLAQFGGGSGAYFQDPYMTCYDKNTQTWARCDTPNLFTKGDQIKVKTHLATDGGKYCLQTKVTGLGPNPQIELPKPLPENLPGAFTPELNLGTVTEQMFTGSISTVQLLTVESDPGCSSSLQYDASPQSPSTAGSSIYRFSYTKDASNRYRVIVPPGVTVDAPFKVGNGNVLTDNANLEYLTPDQLLQVKFNFEGFKLRGMIGAPTGGRNSCAYQIFSPVTGGTGFGTSSGTGYGSGFNAPFSQQQKSISVTAELFLPDAAGSCFNANIPVRAPAFGKAKHTENIVIQLQPLVTQVTSRLHQEFLNGNCQNVLSNALSIINRKQNTMEDATALYYSIACYVSQGSTEWKVRFKTEITNLLKIFFDRMYVFTAEQGTAYPASVTNTAEYQKMETYLCCIAEGLGEKNTFTACATKPLCGSGGSATIPAELRPGRTTCGFSEVIPGFTKPADWERYECRPQRAGEILGTQQLNPTGNPQCWARGMYSSEQLAQQFNRSYGCGNTQLFCCPPSS